LIDRDLAGEVRPMQLMTTRLLLREFLHADLDALLAY
jgi:hypothetical protein